jgi:hypothetical protein
MGKVGDEHGRSPMSPREPSERVVVSGTGEARC